MLWNTGSPAFAGDDGRDDIIWLCGLPKIPSRGCQSAQKSLNFGHAENSPKSRRKTRRRQSPEEGRPRLSGRRFRLYFPRLSRAAAAEPQIRRVAGQCRARLLQHAVEAVARHAAGQPADPSRHRVRQIRGHVPQQALSRLQGAPAAGAGRSDPAISADPRGGARVRPALPGARRLRGRRSDRDLCPRGRRARRDRDHRLLRQGSDAARHRQGRDVRHHEGSPHRHRRGDREIRRAAGKGGRGAGAGRAIPPTTCRACPASASRPRRN